MKERGVEMAVYLEDLSPEDFIDDNIVKETPETTETTTTTTIVNDSNKTS